MPVVSNWSTPWIAWGVSVVVLLTGCVPAGTRPSSTRGQDETGFIELDENTEPRFTAAGAGRFIGIVRIDGDRVYMNGDRVRETMRMPNGAFLETGNDSAARVDFHDGRGGPCRVEISEFRRGRMYGSTQDCTHGVQTPLADAESGRRYTEYHVRVADGLTVITVLRGALIVRPSFDPGRTVTLGDLTEAVVYPDSVRGPYGVSGSIWRDRVDWRDRYDFERQILQSTCTEYASEAASQTRLNRSLECGYDGRRWDRGRQSHFDWCMDVGDEARLESESSIRERMLDKCRRSRDDTAEACRDYARLAVSQNRQNLRQDCGYTGSRWQSDYQAHYSWCTSDDNHRLAERESTARKRALAECDRTGEAAAKTCEVYARRAIAQNKENLNSQCGYTGSRWSSSYKEHYAWCTRGDNHQDADRETKARAAMLKRCTSRDQKFNRLDTAPVVQ